MEYDSSERAINNITNSRIRERVKSYNEWASSIGQDIQYCYAAFLGSDLEGLTCGSKPSRYEHSEILILVIEDFYLKK